MEEDSDEDSSDTSSAEAGYSSHRARDKHWDTIEDYEEKEPATDDDDSENHEMKDPDSPSENDTPPLSPCSAAIHANNKTWEEEERLRRYLARRPRRR